MSNDQACRVIVVNYNAGEALLRCVGSVLANREPLQLVVADNESTDGSCEILRSRFRSNLRLEVLENSSNLGFARAVNAVALRAEEPFLLILNPDCELHPGCLASLRKALQGDSSAALAAPRVVDRQENLLRGSLRRLPDPSRALLEGSGLGALGRWIPGVQGVEATAASVPPETSPAEAVSGACMMIRTELFRGLGGLD